MTQPFTASEMREMAGTMSKQAAVMRQIDRPVFATALESTAQMLRQAADAMEERELWDATLRSPEFNAAKSAAIQAEFAAMQDKGEGNYGVVSVATHVALGARSPDPDCPR